MNIQHLIDYFLGILFRIKAFVRSTFDGIHNEKLKHNILQTIPFWIASVLSGLISVVYTWLFERAETLSHFLFDRYSYSMFLLTPVTFLLAYYIVRRYAPFAKGSGVPQIMASIQLADAHQYRQSRKLMSFRMILVKIGSSLLMILGGGVVGREGPTIQISGAIFTHVNNLLPAWWPKTSKKTMVMTGAAAGLAAAFNTPLGGVVFVMEELTKTHISYFRTAIFTAVIIAGLTAQGILGPYLYIGRIDFVGQSFYVLFAVILVAVIAGGCAGYMGKWIVKILAWKTTFRLKRTHYLYVFLCALILASIAFFIDQRAMGTGKELIINSLFTSDKYDEWYLPIVRVFGGIVSFSTGAAGGIFAPSLSAGSTVGSVVAGWLELSPVHTNIVILSGMVAFLTGITRSPFTSAILVLEMTDRNHIIFHMLIAGLVANLVAYAVTKRSLYAYLKVKYLGELDSQQLNK